MPNLTFKKKSSKFPAYTRLLAILLLLTGILLFSWILFLMQIKAQMVLYPALLIKGVFALFTGLSLVLIACYFYRWMEAEHNKVWILAILGIGLLFIYATADFADDLVITSAATRIDFLEEMAKLLGVGLLIISIGMWIKELRQNRELLSIREQNL